MEGGAWSWDGGAEWTADLAPPPHPGHCLLLGLGEQLRREGVGNLRAEFFAKRKKLISK